MAKPECSKCGVLKTGSYLKESQCGKCIEEKRKLRRKQRREALDLPVYGSGRDPKCKICRSVKEIPYINGSLCRKCKLEKAKIYYEKKARANGVSPQKRGRNPICSKCDAIKENRDDQYCNKCRALMKRERYALNKSNPEFMRLQRKKEAKKFQENELARLKKNCREATHRFINNGKLIKGTCEVCGKNETEAHHDDYMKPLDVRWLCKIHHADHHKSIKEQTK
jgi:hypothetical protein